MFKTVSSKVDFKKNEENTLLFWKEKDIFQKSVDSRRGRPRFTIYEGPPTANGNPGIHHVLARVFKDVIPRYKTMKGFYVPRMAGWDTHGLPVELEVEKKLGLSNKTQIEEYGIAKFNMKCKESVQGYLKNWDAMTERIGYWTDLKHPYVTMDNQYMETVWWSVKQLWDKGLIYQGYRVTPHCPRCGTSLSSHEVALGYEENTQDPSVYVKFKVLKAPSPAVNELVKQKPVYLLAWTTTPWTLPGNTALAVSADAQYAVTEDGDELLILADEMRSQVGLGQNLVVATLKGSELVGSTYEPLYNPHNYEIERRRPVQVISSDGSTHKEIKKQASDLDLSYRVVATSFVTMGEGTGIVHVAPAFGEADFDAGLEYDLDFVQPVDLQGKIMGTYDFAGKFVKEADKEIITALKARGLLYRDETIRHTYPFCWRCATPLLYYAKQTWYIRTTAMKNQLIKLNENINWYPDYIKNGRFGDWLQNNVDWAFSRERYWGTPLPVWQCEKCGAHECLGSLEELYKKSGLAPGTIENQRLGMHRPVVDDIKLTCAVCQGKMNRVPEVIDCWLDSGDMPLAQLHYPFSPDSRGIFEDGRFPADYICEAVDQTRGWFYSLHALSTLLFNQACFRNVICLGHILDAQGEKMSKSKGNVVEPWSIINKYGADTLRWYCLTATPPGNVKRFSEDLVAEITRRFQLILWNVYSFFVMYANIDKYKPETEVNFTSEADLDKWIISELNQLIVDVDSDLETYNPTDAGRKIEGFVDNLSNWYVRRSRRRFWRSENDADKISAYNTLYSCLVTVSKLLAPFMPFLAEELYRNLVVAVFPEAPESVHLAAFPSAEKARIDKQLSSSTQLAIRICSLGRAARSQTGVKVRQPLEKISVVVKSQLERQALGNFKLQILEELNVKNLELVENVSDLEQEGFTHLGEGDLTVALYNLVTPELEQEGTAREIVHRIQGMRKSAGFEVGDYIVTAYESQDEHIQAVMQKFGPYIQQETLSRQITANIPEEGYYQENLKLGDHAFKLGVTKISGQAG